MKGWKGILVCKLKWTYKIQNENYCNFILFNFSFDFFTFLILQKIYGEQAPPPQPPTPRWYAPENSSHSDNNIEFIKILQNYNFKFLIMLLFKFFKSQLPSASQKTRFINFNLKPNNYLNTDISIDYVIYFQIWALLKIPSWSGNFFDSRLDIYSNRALLNSLLY